MQTYGEARAWYGSDYLSRSDSGDCQQLGSCCRPACPEHVEQEFECFARWNQLWNHKEREKKGPLFHLS